MAKQASKVSVPHASTIALIAEVRPVIQAILESSETKLGMIAIKKEAASKVPADKLKRFSAVAAILAEHDVLRTNAPTKAEKERGAKNPKRGMLYWLPGENKPAPEKGASAEDRAAIRKEREESFLAALGMPVKPSKGKGKSAKA